MVYPYQVEMENRRNDLLREAAMRRLAKEIRASNQPMNPFHYSLLAALGRRLSAWGNGLQAHYQQPAPFLLEATAEEA